MSTIKRGKHYFVIMRRYLRAYFFILCKLHPDLAQLCFRFTQLSLQCFQFTSLPGKQRARNAEHVHRLESMNHNDTLFVIVVETDVYLLTMQSLSLMSPLSLSAVVFRASTCTFSLSVSVLYFSDSHPEDHCPLPSLHLFSREGENLQTRPYRQTALSKLNKRKI